MKVSIVTLVDGRQFLGLLNDYTLEQSMWEFTSHLSFSKSAPVWQNADPFACMLYMNHKSEGYL